MRKFQVFHAEKLLFALDSHLTSVRTSPEDQVLLEVTLPTGEG
jgi:hypothetical protein